MNITEQTEEPVPPGWRYYLNMGIRRRWWLIISTIIVWAAALGLSLILPAKYKSETLVLVEQETVPVQIVAPNVSVDLQQRLQNLTEETLSRPRLAQIINEFHLYGNVPGQVVPDDAVKQMRSDISVELIRSTGRAYISAFKIIYSASSPERAQKVTSRLASLFIQDSLGSQQRQSEDTTSFLGSQLEEARKDLEKQEKLLREYRSKNLGELPEQMAGNVQILSGLQDRLQSATASLHQAQQQKLYLGSMIGWSNSATPNTNAEGDAPGTISTPLDEQINKMKADLANLSARYTQRHPDVVHLKEQIANAEEMKRQMAEGEAPGGVAAVQRNQHPITPLTQLQSQFKANELEIANRKQEIKNIEKEIGQYQARLNLTPVREQQLAEVTRNHEQSRTHYESLLAKKLQSEMATDLSKRQQSGQFRSIDPPTLPQKAYWPNRLKFSVIGLFLGTLIGLLAIALKETIDARIYGEDDLSRWVTVPVIATVPPLTTTAERKRQAWQRGVEIAVASALAALVPALTFMAYLKV
jgi:polysaccharide chain length determinant protein (PEP-CTERM system associated)